jgi:hypothetical protein
MKIRNRHHTRFIALGGPLLLAFVASSATASGSVVVGQVAPTIPTPTCSAPVDRVQPTVSSGTNYVVPVSGTITSWSTNAGASAGQLKLKIFRLVSGTTYQAIAQEGPHDLMLSSLNTFTANIPVKAGDLLGLNSFSGLPNCSFTLTGDSYLRTVATSDLANGETADFSSPVADRRLNISAIVDPTNTFTIDPAVLDKKKGVASVNLTLPNGGQLDYSGTGVNIAQIANSGATTLSGPGSVTFTLSATGKKLKKLKKKGKATVNASFTFTPTGGTPNTHSIQVQLKKTKRKKKK